MSKQIWVVLDFENALFQDEIVPECFDNLEKAKDFIVKKFGRCDIEWWADKKGGMFNYDKETDANEGSLHECSIK